MVRAATIVEAELVRSAILDKWATVFSTQFVCVCVCEEDMSLFSSFVPERVGRASWRLARGRVREAAEQMPQSAPGRAA